MAARYHSSGFAIDDRAYCQQTGYAALSLAVWIVRQWPIFGDLLPISVSPSGYDYDLIDARDN
jgi:hypothetical protein